MKNNDSPDNQDATPENRELEIVEAIETANQLPAEQRKAFLQERFKDDASAQSLILEWMREESEPGMFSRAWQVLEPIVQTPSGLAATSETPANIDATTDFSTGQGGSVSKGPERPVELPNIPDHQLGNVLGSGGMGMVVEAFDEQLQINVAIKLMRGGLIETDTARQRFLTEARAVAKLRHPGIVGVMQQGETDDGVLWFSMERVSGEPLDKIVPDTGMPVRDAARITRQVAEALAVAHHANIFHRDIKPANVLLDDENQPRVVDFGLAKDMSTDLSHTQDGRAVGTPYYMAPEQIDREVGPISSATDIYGLGGLLYYLLVKRPPHREETQVAQLNAVLNEDAKSPISHRADIDRDLAAICLKCLEKKPENRYSDASELADDLDRFERGLPVTARTLSRPQRVRRWAQRNPLAVTILAVSLIGVLVSSYFARRAVQGESLAEIRAESLETQKSAVTEKADELEAVNETMQQQLYGADIRDAFQSFNESNFTSALAQTIELIPEPGESDRRGIEWRLLWHRLVGPYRMLHSPGTFFGDRFAHFSLSPDNETLAYSTYGNYSPQSTFVWNYLEGKLIGKFPEISVPRYLRDGKSLVCVRGGEVAICDSSTFKPRLTRSISGYVGDIFSSADGKNFGVAINRSGDEHVEVFATANFKPIFSTVSVPCKIRKASFSPDGKLVACACDDGKVRVSNLINGKTVTLNNGYTPIGVNFSSDGRYLIACPLGYVALIWDTETWTEVARLDGNDKAWRMAKFTPDNRHLIMSGFDGRIWQYSTDDWSLQRQHRSDLTVWWGDISENGKMLVLGGGTGKRDRFEGTSDGGCGIRIFHLDRDFEQGLRWHDWGDHFNRSSSEVPDSSAIDLSSISQWDEKNGTINRLNITNPSTSRKKHFIDGDVRQLQTFDHGGFTGALLQDGSVRCVDWSTGKVLSVDCPAKATCLYRDNTAPEALWIGTQSAILKIVPKQPVQTLSLNDVVNIVSLDRLGGTTFVATRNTIIALDNECQEMWRHSLPTGNILAMAAMDENSVLVSADIQELVLVNSTGTSRWAGLRQNATKMQFSDSQTRLLLQQGIYGIDTWDVATRRSLARFTTTQNLGFDVIPQGNGLTISSDRLRVFHAPDDQQVVEDLLAMAETENANELVLVGLDRQMRWMGLDDADVNKAVQLALAKSRARAQVRRGEDSNQVPWITKSTPAIRSNNQGKQASQIRDRIDAETDALKLEVSDNSFASFWETQRRSNRKGTRGEAVEEELSRAFDRRVSQMKPGTRQPLFDLNSKKIAWIDDRTLLAMWHQDLHRLDLLTGKSEIVSRVADHGWCAVSDPKRDCIYVGTGGSWRNEENRIVSTAPVRILRFDTRTWKTATLHQASEGCVSQMVITEDKQYLVASYEGSTGVRIDLESDEIRELEEVTSHAAITTVHGTQQVLCVSNRGKMQGYIDPADGRVSRARKGPDCGSPDFVCSFEGTGLLGIISPKDTAALLDAKSGEVVIRHDIKMEYDTHSTACDRYLLTGLHGGRLLQLFADPEIPPRIFQIGGNRCAGIAMLSGHVDTVVVSTDQGISLLRLPPVDAMPKDKLKGGISYLRAQSYRGDANVKTIRQFQAASEKTEQIQTQLSDLLDTAKTLGAESKIKDIQELAGTSNLSWESFVRSLPDGHREAVSSGYSFRTARLPDQRLCVIKANVLEMLDLKTGRTHTLLKTPDNMFAIAAHPTEPLVFIGTGAKWYAALNDLVNEVPAKLIQVNWNTGEQSVLYRTSGKITHLECINENLVVFSGERMQTFRHDLRTHETNPVANSSVGLRIASVPSQRPKFLTMTHKGDGSLVNLETDEVLVEFNADCENVQRIAVLGDGKHAALVLKANRLVFIELASGKTVREIEFTGLRHQTFAPHPDGQSVWIGNAEQELLQVGLDPDVPVDRLKLDHIGPLCIEWLDQDQLLAISGGAGVSLLKLFGKDLRLPPPVKPTSSTPSELTPGVLLKPFVAKNLQDKEIRIPDDYPGKLVLLDFWSTWCGPCVTGLPDLRKAYEKWHDSGLEVIGISLDKAESKEEVLPEFLKKHKMTWPQICEGGVFSTRLAKQYGVRGIPTMVLVDGDSGEVLAYGRGGDVRKLYQQIPTLLKKKALSAKQNPGAEE